MADDQSQVEDIEYDHYVGVVRYPEGRYDQRYSRAQAGAASDSVWSKISAEAEEIGAALVSVVPDFEHAHPRFLFGPATLGSKKHMPLMGFAFSPTWAERFLDLSDLVATWSRDPSSKIGAAVVNSRKRVVGMGYNGFPDRIQDKSEWLEDRATKYAMVIHAEVNAILNATATVDGCALFVSAPPCSDCAKFIIQAGITDVHYRSGSPEFEARWADSLERSRMIFARAEVGLIGHRQKC